jgi:hypothetical protein
LETNVTKQATDKPNGLRKLLIQARSRTRVVTILKAAESLLGK